MRIRQHVNPRGAHYARFRGEPPPAARERSIEVEIGCADARFLFERAARDPDRLYVGLEIREDLVDLVNKRARRAAVPVHAVFCHAQLHMAEVFAPASVACVFVNFPDPWFKRRHRARRMVDASLVDVIARVATRGAEVFVQTDVWEIALDAMSAFERDGRFANDAGEWSFWRGGNPYGARSWREEHAEAAGLAIWRLRYRVTG
jgi:tRNA (guanine-N7-)-methyltransferase